MKLGIIGGTGWLGSALGGAVLKKKVVAPQDLFILNRSGPLENYHGYQINWAKDVDDLSAQCEVIVVSVRPEQWRALGLHAPGKLVVSFMAGIGFEVLATCNGRLIRTMPNAAAERCTSWTPWVAGSGVNQTDKETVTQLLSAIGTCDEIPDEAQLTLMTAVSGAGPAYPALMASVLAQFLTEHGTTPEIAERAARNVVVDAAALIGTDEGAAKRIADTFLAYDGTTSAGMKAAIAAGFDKALHNGLSAAVERAKLLS